MSLEQVPLHALKPHPQNPRVSDTWAIKESLLVHGQYRPIVANRRTGHILAGNHTYLAAKELGWKEILVYWVDVPEDQELKILLVDNRSTEFGFMDPEKLLEVLQELDSLEGTGYNDEDLELLVHELLEATEVIAHIDEDEELSDEADVDGEDSASSGEGEQMYRLVVFSEEEEPLLALAEEIRERGFGVQWVKRRGS